MTLPRSWTVRRSQSQCVILSLRCVPATELGRDEIIDRHANLTSSLNADGHIGPAAAVAAHDQCVFRGNASSGHLSVKRLRHRYAM